MNISSVNNYQEMAGIASAKQADIATTQTNTQQATSNKNSDTVSISAQARSTSLSDHHLMTDPVEVFMNWKNNGGTGVEVGRAEKPIDKLLPENQKLISQLKDQEKAMSPDDKRLQDGRISVIQQFGDKEIFTSASDADARLKAEAQAATLEAEYLTQKNGKPPFNISSNLQNIHGYAPLSHNSSHVYEPSAEKHDSNIQSQAMKMYSSDVLSLFNNKQYLDSLLESHYPKES